MSSSKWQPLNGLARKGADSPRGPGRPGRSRTAMRCPLATASAPISHSDCQCRELGRVRHECWESFIFPSPNLVPGFDFPGWRRVGERITVGERKRMAKCATDSHNGNQVA